MTEARLRRSNCSGKPIANRLPNLTLTASDGSSATRLDGLFPPANGFWSLAPIATQPTFGGGALCRFPGAARKVSLCHICGAATKLSNRREHSIADRHPAPVAGGPRQVGEPGGGGEWLAATGVARVARVGARGHLKADSVAGGEAVRHRPQLEGHPPASILRGLEPLARHALEGTARFLSFPGPLEGRRQQATIPAGADDRDGIACGAAQARLVAQDPRGTDRAMVRWTFFGAVGDLVTPLVTAGAIALGFTLHALSAPPTNGANIFNPAFSVPRYASPGASAASFTAFCALQSSRSTGASRPGSARSRLSQTTIPEAVSDPSLRIVA